MTSITEKNELSNPLFVEAEADPSKYESDYDDNDIDELLDEKDIVSRKDHDEKEQTIQGDLDLDYNLLKLIPTQYTDIIAEFADVEIFMISIDSLLLEFTAHSYHNWLLGGQTIVLAEQINKFLTALDELNAKFILIWFTDLKPMFAKDQYLQFLHSFVIAYLLKSKWADAIECFKNPLDKKWNDFLYRLTPSFLLISLENASKNFVNEEINFASCFLSLTFQLIRLAIPVVLFNGFTINFSSVMAYRISIIPILITNFEKKIAKFWHESYALPAATADELSSIYACNSVSEFWALVIKEEIQKNGTSEDFEEICIALLISSLVCEKVGTSRTYVFEEKESLLKGPPLKANKGRRRLFETATKKLESADLKKLKFLPTDLWDGRMIFSIYRKIIAKKEVLPFRLQNEFSMLHQSIGLKTAVSTDTSDKLLDPLSTPQRVSTKLLINDLKLFTINNQLLKDFIPEAQELLEIHPNVESTSDYSKLDCFNKWNFVPVPDKILQFERENLKVSLKAWQIRKINIDRQKLSRWFQNFADSLEGRGDDLLVDFSRVPRVSPITEISEVIPNVSNGVASKKSGGGKKGTKTGKESQISKKEQILKANRDALNKKKIDSDKTKIIFATQVKAHAIRALEEIFCKLELQESKALCIYEKVLRVSQQFVERIPTYTTLEQKREGALDLVEALKQCSVKFWDYFDSQQKEKINNLWLSLGFMKSSSKRRGDKIYDLEMNLVDYQLYHGGRIIDILSDPRKDDRVTGFAPDGWQRKMLDVVDNDNSALIIAPTSAGKTFVSYYCIEKILRKSNDDVVVYISPAKALINQVIGSVYARFRNKPMIGGKSLHGVFTMEYSDNCLNCQVLITIPECLEIMLLSTDLIVQQFVSRIKYVILDEVHCLNASNKGHIWEHIFLLIRCPFLALSATISNIEEVRSWLQSAENIKTVNGESPRKVELITYDERWSELELSIAQLRDCGSINNFALELELFDRGGSIQSSNIKNDDSESVERTLTPSKSQLEKSDGQLISNIILPFHPYGVYKPEKLKMFGIPVDQRLTSRQIVDLYSIMAEIDEKVKIEYEPAKFFGYKVGDEQFIWLNRKGLRDYETCLKNEFLDWLKNKPNKIEKIISLFDTNVCLEFEKRSKPFHMRHAALNNIVSVMDDLKKTDRLPALCFNDDRTICEELAIRLFSEMKNRESEFCSTEDFKRRFNNKAEDKAEKLAKRKRDNLLKEKKRKTKKHDDENEDGGDDAKYWDDVEDDSIDQSKMQKYKLDEELKKFKFYGRWSSDKIYNNIFKDLTEKSADRPSTKRLLRLFERGIGFHHDGLTGKERGSVEILFRAGFLGIVFSTSTLALGMNMPCKTVIFGIDTPFLTPLQFRQMSGRAGRRGFDSSGTVVFMALPTSKIRRLLTSNLATLRGNVPYTTSFLLKLFGYVKGTNTSLLNSVEGETAMTIKRKKLPNALKTVTSTSIRKLAAINLLREPFVLHTRHEGTVGTLKNLFKYLIFFNVQIMRKYSLLNEKCEMTGLAFLAAHLSNFEPGNLIFTILLQSGVLHNLIKQYDDSQKSELKDVIVNILAHIFTEKFIPIYSLDDNVDKTFLDDKPILKPMPKKVSAVINEYNKYVDKLLLACLQLSSSTRSVQNSVLRLSGKCEDLTIYNTDVVSVFDHDLSLDNSFIPTYSLEKYDHRGHRIYRNSFAYDFWKNGNNTSLITHNKLLHSEYWYLISGFAKTLSAIKVALATMARSTDPVNIFIAEISTEFDYKFKRGFTMAKKN